ncbi:MAG TPA: Ig-like domain-containing protein, partial [Vicinamibacterales bacterium]|nr:Ig-like domain-containing protein [Vicinamibacterales bacterium]
MRRARALVLLSMLSGAVVLAAARPADLTIVAAGPNGEIRQLQDASEVRVMFSEPMVSLGRIPSNPTPPWIHITPAIVGAWRWSGTTTLIFTPDPARPLPHATRYTVTVDAAARSAAGQPLGAPYSFSFTTPTVRLTSVRWVRQGERFDRPLALILSFNQRVRPADVVAHLAARYEPYQPTVPVMSGAERARVLAADPDGVARFDAKVADARRVAARSDPVALRVATTWDHERFPPVDTQVVLETTTVPPPGAWFRLTLDTGMPSPEGPARPPEPQQSVVMAARPFFVMGPHCRAGCNPSSYNPVRLTAEVESGAFSRALTVVDITDPSAEIRVAMAVTSGQADRDRSEQFTVEDGGFGRQPPARTWALALDAALQADDGQTLGYPWVGIVDNWHERAFTSFGDGHGVWETSGGGLLPFYARNYQTVTQRLVPLAARDLMPRLLELQKARFSAMPPGTGTVRRLNVTPDQVQSHGL